MKEYVFDKELKEAVIIKRNSQFTMNVLIDGREEKCHCPATTRIGDVDVAGLHCLVSESSDPKRKLKYTVEAISMDDPDEADKNWVGIDLILSNRIVEFLLTVHQYEPTEIKPHLHSTNFEEVSSVMREAVGKGVECWNVDLKFSSKGVKLIGITNTTDDLLKY